MDQETDFGNPKSTGRSIKYGFKELLGSGKYSMGPAAVRYDDALSSQTKQAFGIDSPHDLSNTKNAYIGALDVLHKGSLYTDNKVLGHTGIQDKDAMERGLYWYNNPKNVVNSDAQTFQALQKQSSNLWMDGYNPETRTFEDRFDVMRRAYNSPLQMSPGSYPDKVLQQSKGLHQVINFDDMNVLPEVQVKDRRIYNEEPFKDGGWLDKYNDGGPIQPNYNDASVSMSEDFVGDGYSNVGRNYSPAWGGQFQMGGVVNRFMQPTETFKNYGYNSESNGMSTEYSKSIGGPGEVYLVPGFRQGRLLQDPEGVFNTYGEHLGGPFKTVEAADKFGDLRHKYVEKNQNIPAPFKTRDYAMGGSIGGATQGIPGATGFMYARTGTTPSEDKGRNKRYKTDASAQNGKEMKFYQDGLDFKPKSISKNGSKVIKDDRGQWDHPGEITEIGSNQITMQGVPYPVMGISDTGDMQMMYPDQEYEYDGESVTEYPMMAQGGQLTKLDQLTNFTNYNTKQPGGWLDKYQ